MKSIPLGRELASIINKEDADTILKDQLYDYKSIFLNRIFPDATNPRYFPAIVISDVHAYQLVTRQLTKQQLINLYDANDRVLVGKSCIVNCCKSGSNEWKKANVTIESIIELGENVSVSEVIQAPTIYPIEDGNYQILTGHRRFYAMIYANGVDGAAHFKVYKSKPTLQKVKQFQENASREDLPQYGKLRAFKDALQEIEILNTERKRAGLKALTVRETVSTLGISPGAYDNYNVLTRYPVVMEAYEDGCSLSFIKMKKKVLELEQHFKTQEQLQGIALSRKISAQLLAQLNPKDEDLKASASLNAQPKEKAALQEASADKVKLDDLSIDALKTLLFTDVSSLQLDIAWQEIDWQDKNQVDACLKQLIRHLNELG